MNVIPLLALVTAGSIYYSFYINDDIPLGKTKEGLIVYRVTEKRQCVEFIRRYLALTKGLTFHDVKDANELLHLKTLYPLSKTHKNDKTYKTYKTSFYRPPNVPREGDIIFMNISKWGHVGVVVNVNKNDNTVDIVSQNSDDQKWYYNNDNEGYTERMSLSNPLILGWWRVDEKAL